MSSRDLQILVVVDVYPVVSPEELKSELPNERDERIVLRLTEFGAPHLELPPKDTLVDWSAIGRAVEALAKRVGELRAEKASPTVLYVGGRAPLPVYVHLGYLFSKFGGRQVLLNQPPGGGRWEQFDMTASNTSAERFFDRISGLPSEPSVSTGYLAISVDTAGRDTPNDVFKDFLTEEGEAVAGVVKIGSAGPRRITKNNISAVIEQLTEVLSMAPSCYRHRTGMALFVGGPTQLAFALGRSLNPTVVGGAVWLTNYRDPTYERVYALPFDAEEAPAIPAGDGDKLERRRILDTMIEGIAYLKEYLRPDHLPADVLSEEERKQFIERLKGLRHTSAHSDSFRLSVLRGEFTLGEGLLEAFRRSSQQQREDFAKGLMLHEVLHDFQKVRSTNHFDVGRAGVVLEQIDYAADAFALRAIMRMELDIGGQREQARAREVLTRWLGGVLHGVEAFDILEQGEMMKRLSERRLRRYLAWHLQLARATTLTDASQVDELLRPALTVELAPLAGRIDTRRYEKIVTQALPNTELFCAIGGNLVREQKRPGFEPFGLVDAVRNHATPVIQAAMIALVDEHRDKLAPWAM